MKRDLANKNYGGLTQVGLVGLASSQEPIMHNQRKDARTQLGERRCKGSHIDPANAQKRMTKR
jgi:hypothetical protein